MSLGHKKQFHCKGKTVRLLVKQRQERIVGKFLEYKPAIVLVPEHVAESCLASTDVAFYAYIVVWKLIADGRNIY
jgi:hypothetical protein